MYGPILHLVVYADFAVKIRREAKYLDEYGTFNRLR